MLHSSSRKILFVYERSENIFVSRHIMTNVGVVHIVLFKLRSSLTDAQIKEVQLPRSP